MISHKKLYKSQTMTQIKKKCYRFSSNSQIFMTREKSRYSVCYKNVIHQSMSQWPFDVILACPGHRSTHNPTNHTSTYHTPTYQPMPTTTAPVCDAPPMTRGDEVDNDCDGRVDEENCDGTGKTGVKIWWIRWWMMEKVYICQWVVKIWVIKYWMMNRYVVY